MILKSMPEFKNNFSYIFIFILILLLILFKQCILINDLKIELEKKNTETIRLLNNESAKDAIILNYKLNDSINRAVIQGYQLTQSELRNNYQYLLNGFNDLKKKTAIALAKGTVFIKETLYVKTTTKIDSLGIGIITSTDSLIIDKDNWRKISFKTPYFVKYYKKIDSTEVNFNDIPFFHQIYVDKTKLTLEQSIGLKVGLFQDPKDKKIYIYAQSKYPNLNFSKLEGADIMADKDSRKITNNFRKNWGIGINMGYGVMANFTNKNFITGPYFGVGLYYSPKFLQW